MFVTTRIRTSVQPTGETDAVLTMLPSLSKFYLRKCHEDPALAGIVPTQKASTHYTGGSVGPRKSVDWWRKYSATMEFDPQTVHPAE